MYAVVVTSEPLIWPAGRQSKITLRSPGEGKAYRSASSSRLWVRHVGDGLCLPGTTLPPLPQVGLVEGPSAF